jgi:NAD-dependent SIR2 family protein deacetylase
MGGYAVGKYAQAICDRCGQQYYLKELKKEWTGMKVCQECYEPKHPQLLPKRTINEPIALFEPRPQQPSDIVVFAGAPGDSAFENNGMMPYPIAQALIGGFMLGSVTVEIT